MRITANNDLNNNPRASIFVTPDSFQETVNLRAANENKKSTPRRINLQDKIGFNIQTIKKIIMALFIFEVYTEVDSSAEVDLNERYSVISEVIDYDYVDSDTGTSNMLNKNTNRRRYRETHLALFRGNRRWNLEQNTLNVYSPKTTEVVNFSHYLISAFNSPSANIMNDVYSRLPTRTNEQPLFRWLKLKMKMKEVCLYQQLANSLSEYCNDFAATPTLIIGNWGGGNTQFHEPTPGVGLYSRLAALGDFKFSSLMNLDLPQTVLDAIKEPLETSVLFVTQDHTEEPKRLTS
jgi:hypothetical protein